MAIKGSNLFCPGQRAATSEYRENWDRIFGKKKIGYVPYMGKVYEATYDDEKSAWIFEASNGTQETSGRLVYPTQEEAEKQIGK